MNEGNPCNLVPSQLLVSHSPCRPWQEECPPSLFPSTRPSRYQVKQFGGRCSAVTWGEGRRGRLLKSSGHGLLGDAARGIGQPFRPRAQTFRGSVLKSAEACLTGVPFARRHPALAPIPAWLLFCRQRCRHGALGPAAVITRAFQRMRSAG